MLLWCYINDTVSVFHRVVLVQVNERYISQLQEVLQWPQSIGIVGGRPSSSLYFVGYQGNQVLYLDPHQAQQVLLTYKHGMWGKLDACLASKPTITPWHCAYSTGLQ